jgi:hypothetical protein
MVLIQDARKHNLRLVPLWFASWKKQHVLLCAGLGENRSTPLSPVTRQGGKRHGDTLAFQQGKRRGRRTCLRAFMRHVREVDANDHTVIMVQVENELGMIPDSRDRSSIANELFNQPVPGGFDELL